MEKKLGLKIIRVYQGESTLLEINPDPIWTKYTIDNRVELKSFKNIISGDVVLMLRNIRTGHLLTLSSPILGRGGDCINAWIYVPSDIKIAGKELEKIIEQVKPEILANQRNDQDLNAIFSKEYETLDVRSTIEPSVGEKYAYRLYGGRFQLYEILDNLNQPNYSRFKCVFLLNEADKIRCCSDVEDLTYDNFVEYVRIPAPESVGGFHAFIDGKAFDEPILGILGSSFEIVWKRTDYQPIPVHVEVTENTVVTEPSENQFLRNFRYGSIVVESEDGEKIDDYNLIINQRQIRKDADFQIPEAKLSDSVIEVTSDSYAGQKVPYDFNQMKKIRLGKMPFVYWIPYEYGDGKRLLELEIPGNASPFKSPLKGYRVRQDESGKFSYSLQYRPFTLKIKIISAIVGLLILLIGGVLGYFVGARKEPVIIKEPYPLTNTNVSKEAEVSEKQNSLEAAIRYLNSNNVWNRDKMEKFPEISGLWDAINAHDFDKILSYRGQISGCKLFDELIIGVKSNRSKSFSGKYNSNPSDHDITIGQTDDAKGYIKALYDAKDVTEKKEKKTSATISNKKDEKEEISQDDL